MMQQQWLMPQLNKEINMVDISKVETKEWNDSAERGEWAFMASMLREAQASDKPGSNTGVGVAIGIADERAKSGWRDVTDKPSITVENVHSYGHGNTIHTRGTMQVEYILDIVPGAFHQPEDLADWLTNHPYITKVTYTPKADS
jgi:hypothetical protein